MPPKKKVKLTLIRLGFLEVVFFWGGGQFPLHISRTTNLTFSTTVKQPI